MNIKKLVKWSPLVIFIMLFMWPVYIIKQDSIKERFQERIEYELITFKNLNSRSTDGSISGFSALGFGGISGNMSNQEVHSFSFYTKSKSGKIERVITDYKNVSFYESPDLKVVRKAECYTTHGGKSYYRYREENKRFFYEIFLPLDKIDQHISVGH